MFTSFHERISLIQILFPLLSPLTFRSLLSGQMSAVKHEVRFDFMMSQ
jgi:hypothetical protein